jgi:hypothetical protein
MRSLPLRKVQEGNVSSFDWLPAQSEKACADGVMEGLDLKQRSAATPLEQRVIPLQTQAVPVPLDPGCVGDPAGKSPASASCRSA